MKVRHLKARAIAAHLGLIWSNAYWQSKIDELMKPTPEDIEREKVERAAFWAEMESMLNLSNPTVVAAVNSVAEVEAAKVEYVVAKVSNDEVVAAFDLREDAVALINKHHKQKKAKLYLLGNHAPEHCTEFDIA
jgi:hypothetical protein